MSNLAKKLQQEIQQPAKKQIPESPKVGKKPGGLTPGERILALAFGIIVCIGAYFAVSKQAAILDINKELQLVENTVQDQEKLIGDLEVQVSELSRYDRIKEQAEKLGLTFNENNVKVVQEQ